MSDLSTTYLGLKLKNPLVPSASPLSRKLDTARRLEDAGAAALVMYSLFEEEILADEEHLDYLMHHQDIGHTEAESYLPAHQSFRMHLDQYLEQLGKLKQSLEIPVIASLNGTTAGGWIEHACQLQEAGADALELNVYYLVADTAQSSAEVEARYIDILKLVKQQVSIPVTMKLSPYFSSLGHFVKRLDLAGADGVALFNRFYQPDIDLETLGIVPSLNLSTSAESRLSLRWIAVLHGQVDLSLAATGGVHTASDALKLLLAGADVVHLCSALLKHGPQLLSEILAGISEWLDDKEYESVKQLKGSMAQEHVPDPSAYERANYIRLLEGFAPPAGVWR